MSVETLEANGDFWEAIFGGTGKTLELVLLQEGKEPYRCISGFRKSSSAEWDYKRDYVVPLTEADLPVYDRLVATGEFQGIRMNEQGRMKAMIWRFAEKDRPIDPECRAMFVDFLAGKFSKLIKLAEAEKEPGLVRGALEAGVVTDANKKKITNALKKSTVSQIKALADQLDTIAKN